MTTRLLKYILSILLFVGLLSGIQAFGQSFSTNNNGCYSGTINSGQSQVALIGFNAAMTSGSVTLKQFNIGWNNSTAQSHLANGTLVRYNTANATYSAGTGTRVGNVTFSGADIIVTGFTETISNATYSYFLIADVVYNNAATDYNGQIYINSATFATDVNNNTYTGYISNYINYTFNGGTTPYPLTIANNTTGLTSTSTTLTASYASAVLFSFSITNNSATAYTFSAFRINSNLGTLSNYFTGFRLVASTTNSYPGTGTDATGTASASYANITTFTGGPSAQTLAAGATKYYWLVASRTATSFSSTDVQFNFQNAQSSTAISTSTPASGTYNTATVFGNTFNINVANITITPTTGLTGLTPTGTLTAKQTGVVLFGFTMVSSGAGVTVSQFNINTDNSSIGSYFGNGKLYYTAGTAYSSATQAGTVVFSGNYAVVTMTGSNTFVTGGTTRRYFLVADNISAPSTTTSVTFNFTSGQSSNAVTVTAPTSSTFNTFTGSGNTLTLPAPTLFVTNNANGITAANLISGQTDIVLFGFAVESFGTTPNFTNFQIKTSSAIENQIFTNGRLYRSTSSSTYPGGTATYTSASVSIGGGGYIVCTVNETIPAGSTYYYWFVADCQNNIATAISNYSFGFTSGQGQLAFVSNPYSTAYNYYNVSGQAFNIGAVYDWVGSSSTSYTTAGNWRINGSGTASAPSSTDLVRIGVVGYQYPSNQPTLSLSSNQTIGRLQFGSNNSPVLTLSGALATTLTVTQGISTTAGTYTSTISAPLALVSLPSTAVSAIGAGTTLTLDQGGYTNAGTMSIATGANVNHSGSITGFTNSGTINLAGTGTLSEDQTFTNSGTFTHAGTGAVTFTAGLTNTGTFNSNATFSLAGAQAINNNSATALIFKALVFSGSGAKTLGGSGTFQVSSTGSITRGGTATLAAGTNILTLRSDASGSAQVGTMATTGACITGQLNVERWITGGDVKYRGYRIMGAPVNLTTTTYGNIDFRNLNNAVNINSLGAYTGGPSATGFTINQTTPSIYLYDERVAASTTSFNSGKHKGITQINAANVNIAGGTTLTTTLTNVAIPAGNGFIFYNIGPSTQSNPTPAGTVPLSYAITQKGYLNQGTIPVTLWYTPAGGAGKLSFAAAASTGYNMVGNPYASTIDLSLLTADNTTIESYVYQLNNDNSAGQNYGAWNRGLQSSPTTTQYIASGQGFLVRAKSASSTLTFKEAYKALSNNPTAVTFMSTAPIADNPIAGFFLKMEQDSTNFDYCGVYFNKDFSDTFSDEDALDIDGATPKVYMSSYTSDTRRMAINALGDYKGKVGKSIKLYVNAVTDGTYKIKIEQIKNFDPLYDIWLIDKFKNDSLDLRANDTYSFNVVRSNTATFGAERFNLIVRRKVLPPYKFLSLSGAMQGTAVNLTWKTQSEYDFTGFTVEKLNANNQYDPLTYLQSNGGGVYTFKDAAPSIGNNTYRIKQDDIDSKITYSADVTINTIKPELQNNKFIVYPNPAATTTLNITFTSALTGNVNVMVANSNGTVMSRQVFTQQQGTVDISKLKTGVYYVKVVSVQTGEDIGSEGFVKL